MPDRQFLRTIEAAAVLLYLLQALRVLLSSLFGLVYDVVFADTVGAAELTVVATCVLAAFLTPFVVPQQRERLGLLLTSLFAASARVAMTVNHPTLRLWSSVLVIAASGAYGATLLRRRPRVFAGAMTLAFIAGQFLRVAGHTYDISLRAWWLPVQGLVTLATYATSWHLFVRSSPREETLRQGGIDVAGGLSLGALIFLQTSLLGFPNALARWSGADYALVAPLLMTATLLPILNSAQWGGFALFTLTLLIGWMMGQELYQLSILAPMLLAQLAFISSIWTLAKTKDVAQPRLSFVLGMIFFLILNVALAFAFTYPYTIAFFRDKGDYVFLIAVVVLLLPSLRPKPPPPRPSDPKQMALIWGSAIIIILATTAFAAPLQVPVWQTEGNSLRVGTYNIHYGYNSHWRFSLEQQARTIEQSGADVVLLQEVDAGRITSYGVDDALWLGRRLGMQHVFGPTLENLSGVAVLSRYPIAESRTEHLPSELEQTAIVYLRVQPNRRPPDVDSVSGDHNSVNVYGTWLGLEPEERARQLKYALNVIGDVEPAVLGGDFNAVPGSPTYERLQGAGFEDPFASLQLERLPTSPAIAPTQQIDFVLARGLEVGNAQVLDSLASDHRMVVAEFGLP